MPNAQPAPTPTADSREYMHAKAREMLELYGNDVTAAAGALEELLLNDPEAWDAGIEAVLAVACRYLVRHMRPEMRSELLGTTPEHRQGAGDATTRRLKQAAKSNLYHWPMTGGGWLGDATREDVDKERSAYQARSDANGARARMFERIHAAMKGKGTVREQIAEEKLAEIARKNGIKH